VPVFSSTGKEFHLGFRVAYNGKDFCGFQAQANQRSLQSELEKVFTIFFRKKIQIDFTSRTDAGVHAYDQWILIKEGYGLYKNLSNDEKERFLHSLNALLPSSIKIWSLLKLERTFHPKKSPSSKEYLYKVFHGPLVDPLMQDTVWWVRAPLDLHSIKKALKEIEGTHDFSAFSKSSGIKKKDCVRKILKATVRSKSHSVFANTRILEFRFSGTGFLHHMVRNLVGTLIAIGAGNSRSISEILRSKDRRLAGKTAPAAALILYKTNISKKLYKPLLVRRRNRT
jgi:tRNA pseudouridine38-40 synthase